MAGETLPPAVKPAASDEHPLRELAGLFLKLGTIAFGGPAAHIAMMEDELFRRRRWMTHAEFLDLLAVTNLIPGPNSTEMAVHIGHRRAGWPGLLVAGVCFIAPAILIVTLLAWAYVRFSALPVAEGLLRGVTPVVVAIIAQALWRLGQAVFKTWLVGAVALIAAGANFLGVGELLVLAGAGVFMLLVWGVRNRVHGRSTPGMLVVVPPCVPLPALAFAGGTAGPALWPIFLFFLKVGSVLYGSGYVLIAFLRADLVERWGWITESQLLDAVAVGQVTPGPLFTTATFIGYLLAGPLGAAVATGGIFLPAFVFVAASAPFIPRLRRSAAFSAILDGLNAGSLALMAVVTLTLARTVVADWRSLLVAGLSAVLLYYRVSSTWLIVGGALAGTILW